MGELEKARVEGLSFSEIQDDVFRLIRSFACNSFNKYYYIGDYGFSIEDIVSLSYICLCKRKEDGLSYLEKYFLEASDKGFKYLVCVLKKVVTNTVLMINRRVFSGRLVVPLSLDVVGDIEGPDKVDTRELEYNELLNSIPSLTFKNYEIRYRGKVMPLDTKNMLNLLVEGLSKQDMLSSIYNKKTGELISPYAYVNIRFKVISLAREYLKNYKKL